MGNRAKKFISFLVLLVSASWLGCNREEPEPISLNALITNDSSPETQPTPMACDELLRLRVADWQAFLDRDLLPEDGQDLKVRSLLSPWVPEEFLTREGVRGLELDLVSLSWSLDQEGVPVLGDLDLRIRVQTTAAPSPQLLARIRGLGELLQTMIPTQLELKLVPGPGAADLTLTHGTPAARETCSWDNPPAELLWARLNIPGIIRNIEAEAGTALLWAVLPEELSTWKSLTLSLAPAGEDLLILTLDTGTDLLPGLLSSTRFPPKKGWSDFLPLAQPYYFGFFLHEATGWTTRLSKLMFEKGFSVKTLDPEEILDDSWQTQLGKLVSGPVVGIPGSSISLKDPVSPSLYFLQAAEVEALHERLLRIFDIPRRYATRSELWMDKSINVVRFKQRSKDRETNFRFGWHCTDTGCWLSQDMAGIQAVLSPERGVATPQARRFIEMLEGPGIAVAVVSPRAVGLGLEIPPKASMTDRLVISLVKSTLSALPENLLLEAGLIPQGNQVSVEVRGLLRFLAGVRGRLPSGVSN